MFAAVDIGTNSVILLVFDHKIGGIEAVIDKPFGVKLGESFYASKSISKEALVRFESCLKEIKFLLDKHQVKKVKAVATSAMREASNAEEVHEIAARYGLRDIEVISGEREAELTLRGVTSAWPQRQVDRVVVDIGGGSTEIVVSQLGQVDLRSLPIGVVRLREAGGRKDLLSALEIAQLKSQIVEELSSQVSCLKVERPAEMWAVGGTSVALAMLSLNSEFNANKIEGTVLSTDYVDSKTQELFALTVEQRKFLPGIDLARLETLPYGAVILRACMEALKKDFVSVSTRGIRYGLALEIISEK